MLSKIKALPKKAMNFIKEGTKKILSKAKHVVLSLLKRVKNAVLSLLRKVANKVSSFCLSSVRKIKNWLKLNVSDNVKFGVLLIKTFFVSLFSGMFKNGFDKATDDCKEKVESLVKKNPGSLTRFVTLAVSFTAFVLCISAVWFWNVNTVAVSVNTNGVCVGYITSSAEYDDMFEKIDDLLIFGEVDSYVSKVTLGYGIANKNEIKSGYEIAAAVLNAQKGVKPVKGLFVNGKFATCASNEQVLISALDARVNVYHDENTIKSEITDDIVIRDVFYPLTDVISDEEATEIISNPEILELSVATTKYEEKKEPIAFNTITTFDSKKIIGYNRVKTQGKKGSALVTSKCTYINGVVTSVETISTEIVSMPTDRVIVSGTSTYGVSSVQQSLSSSGYKFLWPIAVTDRMYISSYFGDSRNHTGIDITGYEGTDIYASLDGTVSYAGPASGYGYVVIINHKGGYQTAYGHVSAIYVKSGQTVKQGDVIAACGHTGRATGDHVHFEIRKNGSVINPANYIGIY